MEEEIRRRWVKFRTCHAWGNSQWEYRECIMWEDDDNENLNDLVSDYADEMDTFSDKYRGAEAEFENPPLEWIESELKKTESDINKIQEYQIRLNALKKSF